MDASAQIYKKCPFVGIFRRLGPFAQVFRHVKVWLILHKMIEVSHLVAYPVLLTLLCDLRRKVGVLRLTKKAKF